MKPKHIHKQMSIHVTPDRMWQILYRYGDVYKFHGGVVESHAEDGSHDSAALGCERVCNIVDMGLKIMLKERIIDYVEGRSYTYEIYEWKNLPLRNMLFGFRILDAGPAETVLAIDIDYLTKPAWLTPLMALKMRRLAKNVLLGYKHFAETGEQRIPIGVLKQRYRDDTPALARQS